MAAIIHDIYVPEAISEDLSTGGRIYKTPSGKIYPSITTILKHRSSASIEQWKTRVGEEEAKKITTSAGQRGSSMHSLIEDYLVGKPLDKKHRGYYHFGYLQNLVNNISEVYMQEKALYSDFLKVAGRVDCIGIYKGILSIIDFKTSRKQKKKEWITSYFVQGCFYAEAFKELTNGKYDPQQIVILVANDDGTNSEFIVKKEDYFDDLITVIDEYNELNA